MLPLWDFLCSVVKSVVENRNGGSSTGGYEELALSFVTWSSSNGKWGDNTREVQSLNLQGENPMSCLNWLCLAITLLKSLFCERVLSHG
jgi:hypothetical protein